MRIFFNALIIIIIAGSTVGYAVAQQTGASPTTGAADIEKMMQSAVTAGNADLLKSDGMAVDNVINPKEYHIGPGDILALQLLSGTAIEQLLAVTPENSVLLPRLGEVSLTGKTLAQAKDTILQIIQKRNPNATASVTLRKPRICYVTIKGNVAMPGTYSLPATMKVSTAIKLASQKTASASASPAAQSAPKNPSSESDRLLSKSTGMSSFVARNIVVRHNDGTSETADIEKAIATGTTALDPLLRESDEIFVPYESGASPTITISGAVQSPRVLAYKKGDKASFLLKSGYGLTDNARPNGVYLIQNGVKRPLKTNEKLQLTEPDFELQPGSVIIAEQDAPLTGLKQGVVEVTGNVKSPGAYSIEQNSTRLREVIEQAGGFTEEAYLPLAYILRRERPVAPGEENTIAQRGLQYTDLVPEDTARFINHTKDRRPLVSCDIAAAFTRSSNADNVQLQDGDVIVVPSNPQRVFVYGQVNKPGYLAFTPGKTMEWYIEQAGGFAAGAEKSLARIIKGRTKVWSLGGENVFVESGDEIYAPPPTIKPIGYEIQNYTLLVTAIGALVGVAGFIYNVYLNSKK
ncbi:MAG: SLBB domain-containing protein [Candidatus Kapaibacterium sp.]